MIDVYCEEAICRSRVYEWDELYLDSRGNLNVEPKTAKIYINIEKVCNMLPNYCHFTMKIMSETMNVNMEYV